MSNSISLKINSPAQLDFVLINFQTTTINKDSPMKISFYHIYHLPVNVIIELIFPNDFPLSYSKKFTFIDEIKLMTPNLTFNSNDSSIVLINSTNQYYGPKTIHSFQLNLITNPVNIKDNFNFLN